MDESSEFSERVEREPEVPKRGRGRPKGSLNRKTLERLTREAEEREAPEAEEEGLAEAARAALDVDFESEEVLGAPSEEETASDAHAVAPKLKRERSATAPRSAEGPRRGPRARPMSATAPRSAVSRREAPKESRAASRSAAPITTPPNYLDILKQGLDAARTRHKAEKVARYDAFFSH